MKPSGFDVSKHSQTFVWLCIAQCCFLLGGLFGAANAESRVFQTDVLRDDCLLASMILAADLAESLYDAGMTPGEVVPSDDGMDVRGIDLTDPQTSESFGMIDLKMVCADYSVTFSVTSQSGFPEVETMLLDLLAADFPAAEANASQFEVEDVETLGSGLISSK